MNAATVELKADQSRVPAVSVIVPAYNSAATLARALDSILAQTFTDYEIVVVDDGSTDDLATAAMPYAGRMKLIRQENKGAAAARNTGAKAARGSLLAFLDADDFWHARKLELQVAAFAARSDVVLCWTRGRRFVPQVDQPPQLSDVPQQVAPEYSADFASLFLAPYLGTPGVVIRKQRFEELDGFREDLKSAEDVDLWLRAAYERVTACVPAPLFYVVPTANSLTALHRDGTFKDNLQVIGDFCRVHPDFVARHPQLVRSARAKVNEDWGSSALIKSDYALARRLLVNSLRDRVGFRAAYLLLKVLVGSICRVTPAAAKKKAPRER